MISPVQLLKLFLIFSLTIVGFTEALSNEIDRVQLVRELPVTGYMRDMISFNNAAFFLYSSPQGLWRSDGTDDGTKVLKSIPDSMNCGFITQQWGNDYAPSQSNKPIVLNGHFFFYIHKQNNESELWKSNGTVDGTVLLQQTGFGGLDSYAIVHNILYILGGHSLWRTDGTSAGTRKVATLNNAISLVSFDNRLFFASTDSTHDQELWVSNGTSAGTKLFVDIKKFDTSYPCGHFTPQTCTDSDSWPRDLIVHQNTLYFTADDGVHGRELWRSDGTTAGTRMFADIGLDEDSKAFTSFTTINNHLLFSGYDATHGRELWITDGSKKGTFLLADLKSGAEGSLPLIFFAAKLNGTLYFTTWDTLWKTDGTRNGTTLVKNGLRNRYSGISSAILNERLYFGSSLADNNNELWVTDGTPEGTSMVRDILPGKDEYGRHYSSIPQNFVNVGSFVLFDAYYEVYDSSGGYEEYKRGLFKLERGPANISPTFLPLLLN